MSAEHPLSDVGLKVKKFKCFGTKQSGFDVFTPINIIIGRNNSGKSALLDLIDLCISQGEFFDPQLHGRTNSRFEIRINQKLDAETLQRVFRSGFYGGGIPGPDHGQYGQKFIGHSITQVITPKWKNQLEGLSAFDELTQPYRQDYSNKLNEQITSPFKDVSLLRVAAERDVQPEISNHSYEVSAKGSGVTNLVRAFLNSDALPREEVEQGLLQDLNKIYSGDCEFTRILCQENAQRETEWELFLEEKEKGDIRLSQSGSSLKSIFIILCMMRLYPVIKQIDWTKIVFSVEEPENNLHPALLRRLLDFLAEQREQKRFTLIVTTHSPIGIDWSAKRDDSQIIHVQHNGYAATTNTATEYHQNREIIDDLDIRASDLLQANGVIWVEGPSDRIYLKRWIKLHSNDNLKEGIHYTIMFYGGKLLSHLDGLPPDQSEELISLLSINRNCAIVIDSDRHQGTSQSKSKPRMHLNTTKRRIRDEMRGSGGYVWVTEGREIENYIPIEVFVRVVQKIPESEINQYTAILSLPFLSQFKENKVAVAHEISAATEKTT